MTLFSAPIEEIADWSPGDLPPGARQGSIPYHPLANLFPMLVGAEFAELVEDIRSVGILEPIVLIDQGEGPQILDGRNRYLAGIVAGAIDPGFAGPSRQADGLPAAFRWFGTRLGEDVESADLDLTAWVLSHNLLRRHLSDSQRAMIAARLETLDVGRPPRLPAGVVRADATHVVAEAYLTPEERERLGLPNHANLHNFRRQDAATALKVSPRSVADAAKVQKHGVDELAAAVDRGEASVSAAAAIAALPVDEQIKALEEISQTEGGRQAFARVAKRAHADRQRQKAAKRAQLHEDLGRRIAALPQRRYAVMVADPEWKFKTRSEATGMDRAPENHYPTSELVDLQRRGVPSIAADDCVLFLWATVPMLAEAFCVLDAWGFSAFVRDPETGLLGLDKRDGRYVSSAVWKKYGPNGRMGMGYWFRIDHEILLVATRGNASCPQPAQRRRSVLDVPASRIHSQKPQLLFEMIDEIWPSPTWPKIELNARRARPGWDTWGTAEHDDQGQT